MYYDMLNYTFILKKKANSKFQSLQKVCYFDTGRGDLGIMQWEWFLYINKMGILIAFTNYTNFIEFPL